MDLETELVAEKEVKTQSNINKKLAMIEGYKNLIKNFDSNKYLKKDFEQYARWADGLNKYMRDQGYKGEDYVQKTPEGYKLTKNPQAVLSALDMQKNKLLYGNNVQPAQKKRITGISYNR